MKWTRIIVLIVTALWLVPGAAFAHSVLESAVPAKGETVTVSPAEISMAFNTDIESLSKFKLINAAGDEMEISDSSVDGNQLSGKVAAPLANGSYTVKWTIIGADGHTLSGDYSFAVEAQDAASTETPTAEASEAPSEQPQETATPVPSADANNASTQSTMSFAPILVVAVVIVVMAAVAGILVYRRNKK